MVFSGNPFGPGVPAHVMRRRSGRSDSTQMRSYGNSVFLTCSMRSTTNVVEPFVSTVVMRSPTFSFFRSQKTSGPRGRARERR